MQRVPVLTKDGSHTISIPEMNVTYHSVHGAIQESMHIFIEAGLRHCLLESKNKNLSILEMGFGTGLNALLTFIEVEKLDASIYYTALESSPLAIEIVESLNYCTELNRPDLKRLFLSTHISEWDKTMPLNENFLLHKRSDLLQNFTHSTKFNIIYFDAFAPSAQPELWTVEIFTKLYHLLHPGGILVTYCSKGDVRRAMQAAGFTVQKIPGPPGKREVLKAIKINDI